MKLNSVHILFFAFIFAGCDQPIRNRVVVPDTYVPGQTNTNTTNGNTNGNTGTITDGGTTTTPTVLEPGYENCSLTMSYTTNNLGSFSLCQSKETEIKFKAKLQNASTCIGSGGQSTSCGVCFVPMHKNSDGTSYMVGQAQCVQQEANKLYDGNFYKSINTNINAAMIIHRGSLDSFVQCMTAKSSYMNARSGCSNDYRCISAADSYANTVCNSFTAQHSGYYKQITF